MREPDIPLGLTGECLASWAEPSDCEVRVPSIAEELNIASALDAPAEVAPPHLAPFATHTLKEGGVCPRRYAECYRFRQKCGINTLHFNFRLSVV
mgnify:CR=1 FL=1